VVRAFASRQCGPGSIPARCHMWIEVVVGSRLALLSFPLSGFSPPTETNTFKFQFGQDRRPVQVDVVSSLNIVFYYNYLYN